MHSNHQFKATEIPQLFENIQEYLETDNFITKDQSPEQIRKKMSLKISDKPEQDLVTLSKQYLQNSVKTSSPQFLNQLWAGFSYPSLIAEIVANVSNSSMFTYEVSPLGTLIEKEMIQLLMDYAGFKDGEGIFTTGGTASNISALLAARNSFSEKNLKEGVKQNFHIYASELCHYSFIKAANITGIGTENVIKVKADDSFKMDPEDLELAILKTIEQGSVPLFVAATSGTTVEGAFDPLVEISKICKKHNIWFHVDGAYGGSFLLSEKHRKLLTGIELANSLTWDPHKLMSVPLVCSVLLINQSKELEKAHYHGEKDGYLFHDDDTQHLDIGKSSIQCGRRPDALKLFFTWKYYGKIEMGARIDKLIELAKYAEQKVNSSQELELFGPRESINICFRYKPKNSSIDINKFNISIREELIKQGLSMVNFAKVRKQTIIRLVITSADIHNKDIDNFFSNFMKVAHQLDVSV